MHSSQSCQNWRTLMFSPYLLPLWAFFGITFHYPHLRKVSDQSVSVQKIRTRVFQIFTLFLAAGLSDKVGRDGEVAGKGIMSGKTELVQHRNIWYWYPRTRFVFLWPTLPILESWMGSCAGRESCHGKEIICGKTYSILVSESENKVCLPLTKVVTNWILDAGDALCLLR